MPKTNGNRKSKKKVRNMKPKQNTQTQNLSFSDEQIYIIAKEHIKKAKADFIAVSDQALDLLIEVLEQCCITEDRLKDGVNISEYCEKSHIKLAKSVEENNNYELTSTKNDDYNNDQKNMVSIVFTPDLQILKIQFFKIVKDKDNPEEDKLIRHNDGYLPAYIKFCGNWNELKYYRNGEAIIDGPSVIYFMNDVTKMHYYRLKNEKYIEPSGQVAIDNKKDSSKKNSCDFMNDKMKKLFWEQYINPKRENKVSLFMHTSNANNNCLLHYFDMPDISRSKNRRAI